MRLISSTHHLPTCTPASTLARSFLDSGKPTSGVALLTPDYAGEGHKLIWPAHAERAFSKEETGTSSIINHRHLFRCSKEKGPGKLKAFDQHPPKQVTKFCHNSIGWIPGPSIQKPLQASSISNPSPPSHASQWRSGSRVCPSEAPHSANHVHVAIETADRPQIRAPKSVRVRTGSVVSPGRLGPSG